MPDINDIISSALTETASTEDAPAEELPDLPPVDAEPESEPEAEAQAAPSDPWKHLDSLTEEDLATPEGRALMKQRRTELGRGYAQLKKREAKLSRKGAEFAQERQTVATLSQQLHTSINALRTGSAKEVLQALGQITGQDPRKLYESLTLQMATGKATDPELEAIKAELREQKQREAAREAAQQDHVERQAERQALTIANDASRFPHLASFAGTKPAEVIQAFRDYADELRGTPQAPRSLDDLAAIIEAQLTASLGQHSAGRTPSAATAAKSESGSQPTKPRTVAPSLANRPAQRRELSESEQRAALVQDPNFWSALGLSP